MSYIPDCREDEYYNQKYLKGEDREFVNGFDYCAEETVDCLFDNLDTMFDDDSYIMHVLNEEVPKQEEYDMEWTFGHKETEHRVVKTYADLLRMKILEWVEMERNELITSMIDSMDEDEYKAIKERVDGRVAEGNGQTVVED